MSHLILDIGNSALKIARASGSTISVVASVQEAAWPPRRRALRQAIDTRNVDAAAIVSVVPAQTKKAVAELTARVPRVILIGPDAMLPFEMAYSTPETLGNDRLAAAAGAFATWGTADGTVLVVDAGTAVNYEVVSDGVYLGGAIALGPRLLQRGLHTGTAQLPDVTIEYTVPPVGDSTYSAIQSGVVHQFIDSVDGMLRRLREETPAPHVVVVTGGWATLLAESLPHAIDHVAPDLVLRGGQVLLERALTTAL